MMEIRSTEIKDLPLVMEIYDYARAFMRATGNTTQWIDGYPSVFRSLPADESLHKVHY